MKRTTSTALNRLRYVLGWSNAAKLAALEAKSRVLRKPP